MKRALALVLCFGALAAGCSRTASTPAATVNGVTITNQDVIDELEAIGGNTDYLNELDSQFSQANQAVRGATPGSYDAAFVAAVLTRRMQFALVHSEVERRNLHPNDACRNAAMNDLLLGLGQSDANHGKELFDKFPADYQQMLRQAYDDQYVLRGDLSGLPCGDPNVAKTYFDSHTDEFTQYCISLIAVNDENTANSLVGQLRGGADFATLAQQFSTDQQTAAAGGDAGCHIPAEFPSSVSPIVQQTAVGAVADPISNNAGGFIILKVTDRKTAAFEEVAAQADELAQRAEDVAMRTWLLQAQASAKVDLDPRYGTFDPASFSIKPPPIDTPSGSDTTSSGP